MSTSCGVRPRRAAASRRSAEKRRCSVLRHQRDEVGGGRAQGHDVGVGEEVALVARPRRQPHGEREGQLGLARGGDELLRRAESRLLRDLRHLLDAQPLGEGDAHRGHDLAHDRDLAQDRDRGVARLERVDAGDEAVLQPQQRGEDAELGGGADDAQLLQLVRDLVRGAALREDVALRGDGVRRGGGGDDFAAERRAGRLRQQRRPEDDAAGDDAEAHRHEQHAPAEQPPQPQRHAPPPVRASSTACRSSAAAAESSAPSRWRWRFGGT